MAETKNAEPTAPKSPSQQALARQVLAARTKVVSDMGMLSPRMRRGIERMQENIGKVK